MTFNFKAFLRKAPTLIEIRISYHFLILLINLYFLQEFLTSQFGKRTIFQKFFYLTSLNQISIIVYYIFVLFYNINLYVNGYPKISTNSYPKKLLIYLRTNLSIACFVAISFWVMKIFFPEMIIPPKSENVVYVAPHVDLWVHFFNFFFLSLELIWEQNKRFVNRNKSQFHIYLVIFGIYSVLLLFHNLYYKKDVYPFLKHLNFITALLMAVVINGLVYILDSLCSLIINELWI